ncbi:MAG: type VII toxin-antitoxin system HepT family RNase toxin [Tepidiformaceae bacterium]
MPRFAGIESRLEKLDDCLNRLEAIRTVSRAEFLSDPDLQDIAARRFEVAGQCCIDLALRIISLEGAPRREGGQESLLALGQMGILHEELAQRVAPVAGFRNVLAHDYVDVDWTVVHAHLSELGVLWAFAQSVRDWMGSREAPGT